MEERTREPTLPGTILKSLYLDERGVTIRAFAEAVGVTPKHMSRVIHGKARIEAELAARIAKVLGTSERLWLNLQAGVDIWQARQKIRNWRPSATYLADANTGNTRHS
ncbi:MAG: HigA family addiction module antidote protein [Pirellulaceae bacterium]|nr:HigA family addiction module antidote protein [Pirellulaceae bacterium]